MTSVRSTCPDCNAELRPIRIVDAAVPGLGMGGLQHGELSYTAPDAKRSFFSGKIKSEGNVKASLCSGCGRILLYAEGESTS